MGRPGWPTATTLRKAIGMLGVAGLLAPVASEVRFKRPLRPLTDRWTRVPVAPRGTTLLGISFRPLQCEALGLEPAATLRTLLAHPFAMIRLGAYWDRMEPDRGRFDPDPLDRQVDAAEAAGKQIIVAVGAVKTFGYPECFVPAHHLDEPLREGMLIEPWTHPGLLDAATAFVTRVVDRYRDRSAIVAWQVEHEPVDPSGSNTRGACRVPSCARNSRRSVRRTQRHHDGWDPSAIMMVAVPCPHRPDDFALRQRSTPPAPAYDGCGRSHRGA